MHLISLNIWGGQLYQPLVDFLDKHKNEVDVFCFQEVFENEENVRQFDPKTVLTLKKIKEILKDHDGYFEDYVAPGNYGKMGLATFIRRNIDVTKRGEIFLYNPPEIEISNSDLQVLWRNLQYLLCNKDGQDFLIANMHGLYDRVTPTHKNDLPERIQQSHRAKALLDKFSCLKILCGDFNLWPETESLSILEEGMRNLIKEYGITSTRSAFFNFPNKYADYVLVSRDIDVKDFKVLEDTVSDHLPLYLEFE